MIFQSEKFISSNVIRKTTIFCLIVVFLFIFLSIDVSAQKTFNKSYPASKNIRLQLTNRAGTVTVEGWNKDEVRINAYLEAPAATIVPQNLSGKIVIDVKKDNQGRGEVGEVNFTIRVPYNSSVDIETMIGNLKINNINGGLVRAHISTDGDITLTNIEANMVSAENGTGDIFFDGELRTEGTYRFTSTRGNINIRIPLRSSFSFVATAPSTRNITLGQFGGSNLTFVGDGRRVRGKFGDGSATLYVTNQRGSISFISR